MFSKTLLNGHFSIKPPYHDEGCLFFNLFSNIIFLGFNLIVRPSQYYDIFYLVPKSVLIHLVITTTYLWQCFNISSVFSTFGLILIHCNVIKIFLHILHLIFPEWITVCLVLSIMALILCVAATVCGVLGMRDTAIKTNIFYIVAAGFLIAVGKYTALLYLKNYIY